MDGDNIPYAIEVYAQVVVDQKVSKSRDGSPVNLGMELFKILTDPLRGFCQGLEIAQDGILNQFRRAKGLLTVLTIPFYAARAIEIMTDIKAIVLHKGIASRSMRSRIRG